MFAFPASAMRKGTHASDMKPVWITRGGGPYLYNGQKGSNMA